jgi:hypothetical protein
MWPWEEPYHAVPPVELYSLVVDPDGGGRIVRQDLNQ